MDAVQQAIAAAQAAAAQASGQTQQVIPPSAPTQDAPPFAVPPGFTAVKDQAGNWGLVPLQAPVIDQPVQQAPAQQVYQPQPQPQQAYQPQPQPQQVYQPQPNYGTPAVAPSYTPPAVAQPGGVVGKRVSLREMAEEKGVLNLDFFLSVDENGIKVKFPDGDTRAHLSNQLLSNIKAVVNFAEIQPKYSIRYRKGGNTIYHRSVDRAVDEQGVAWSIRLAEAKQAEPGHRGDYTSVDFVCQVTEDVTSVQGQRVLYAGDRIGFSTSVTNWAAFYSFFTKALAAGEVIEHEDGSLQGEVPFVLGFLSKATKENKWGIFTFTREGDLADSEPEIPTTKKK